MHTPRLKRAAYILSAPVNLLHTPGPSLGSTDAAPDDPFVPGPDIDTVIRRLMRVVEASGILEACSDEKMAVMTFTEDQLAYLRVTRAHAESHDSMLDYITQSLRPLGVTIMLTPRTHVDDWEMVRLTGVFDHTQGTLPLDKDWHPSEVQARDTVRLVFRGESTPVSYTVRSKLQKFKTPIGDEDYPTEQVLLMPDASLERRQIDGKWEPWTYISRNRYGVVTHKDLWEVSGPFRQSAVKLPGEVVALRVSSRILV